MWLVIRKPEPDRCIKAIGEMHSVRIMLEADLAEAEVARPLTAPAAAA
jgi:hypothetical protein